MELAFELLTCVAVVVAIPAVARLARRMSKGQAAGAMMAIGFFFAAVFQGKPPQTTEETSERLRENASRKEGADDQM